jgi:hypothetical protein
MSTTTNEDWAYAQSYSKSAREQELPYHLQLKRTRLLAGFYRAEISRLIQQYRLWLSTSEYLRFMGLLNTPRTHQYFLLRIRKSLRQYRAQMMALSDLKQRRIIHMNKPEHKADMPQLNEMKLYDKLEMKYGPSTAQKIIDEIKHTKMKDSLSMVFDQAA